MPTLQAALTKLTFLLLSSQVALAAQTTANYSIVPPQPTRPTISQIYALAPILRTIAACESTGSPTGQPRQFLANGSPLWGEENDPTTGKVIIVQRDVGELQINTWAHAEEIKKLGLDVIGSEADNVYYGYLLYQQSGTVPWNASKKTCWGQTVNDLGK